MDEVIGALPLTLCCQLALVLPCHQSGSSPHQAALPCAPKAWSVPEIEPHWKDLISECLAEAECIRLLLYFRRFKTSPLCFIEFSTSPCRSLETNPISQLPTYLKLNVNYAEIA